VAILARASGVPVTVLKMAGTSLLVSTGLRVMGAEDDAKFTDELVGVALVAGLGVLLYFLRGDA